MSKDIGEMMDAVATREAQRAEALLASYTGAQERETFAEGYTYGAFVAGRISLAMDMALASK